MFIQKNPNPLQKSTGDCVIRALSFLLDKTWDEIYLELCIYGYMMKDFGNQNSVWERFLYDLGYKKGLIPNTCPNCFTIKDFCNAVSNIKGRFLLSTGSHTATIIDGTLYDSWNSLSEIPIFIIGKKIIFQKLIEKC